MNARMIVLLAWAFSAGSAMAETGALTPQPVAETQGPASEPVRRETTGARGYNALDLSAAEVVHVDKNGDGKISFQELLVHDF